MCQRFDVDIQSIDEALTRLGDVSLVEHLVLQGSATTVAKLNPGAWKGKHQTVENSTAVECDEVATNVLFSAYCNTSRLPFFIDSGPPPHLLGEPRSNDIGGHSHRATTATVTETPAGAPANRSSTGSSPQTRKKQHPPRRVHLWLHGVDRT
jgi:hypothetical protein